jgi:hypothetical protein
MVLQLLAIAVVVFINLAMVLLACAALSAAHPPMSTSV